MNRLYVSDLDGTLLNTEARVSRFTVQTLKTLIDKGLCFTVATARTSATVIGIMKDIPLPVPAILMNGVILCDLATGRYIHTEYIGEKQTEALYEILGEHGLNGFLYTVENGRLSTCYERLATPQMERFYEERVRLYHKPFTRVASLAEAAGAGTVYLSMLYPKEVLESVAAEMAAVPGVTVAYYRDVYNDGFWVLEAYSAAASKANAMLRLKTTYNFDYITVFGDNYNDLPMFQKSDTAIAVGNAVDAVKEAADAVIGTNLEDGVARWLAENAV